MRRLYQLDILLTAGGHLYRDKGHLIGLGRLAYNKACLGLAGRSLFWLLGSRDNFLRGRLRGLQNNNLRLGLTLLGLQEKLLVLLGAGNEESLGLLGPTCTRLDNNWLALLSCLLYRNEDLLLTLTQNHR